MKKIYLLLFTLLTVSFSFGQELLVNGSLESWDSPTSPTGWPVAFGISQESTQIHGGTYSAKQTGAATGNQRLSQTITGIIPGTSYTISLWYKVESGDGTDARIWSAWRSGTTNLPDNEAELHGPANAYFDNNGNQWTQYTVTLTAPATADSFLFEMRTYSNAVVYWDDLSFSQQATTTPALGIVSPSNGSNIAGPDVSVALSVLNFVVGNPGGGIDGHIKYSLDGSSAVSKYDTNPINLTGLSSGSHTLDLELVDNSGNPLATPVTTSISFVVYEAQTLPYTEHFDYTAGANLADQPAWTNHFSGDDVVIASGSLSYSTLIGSGNSISFDGSGADPVVNYTATSSGNIYSSFMLQVDSFDAAAIDGYFAVLRTANDDYVGRLWISPTSATTYRIGVGTGGTLNVIDTTDHNIGDTIFIVFSYDIDNNVVSAWINPTLGGAQPAANITEASASTGNVFNQFMIRQDNNTKTPFIVMDELRIATSWADVTPSTLSISQFNASTFNVYPNPTSTGFVNITSKSNESMQVAVFDILGKQILNQTVNNNRLDVSTLTTGVYILKISQNGQAITKKLVVK